MTARGYALAAATALVKRFEGLRDGDARRPGLQPYRDPVGLWTIGWGELLSPDPTIAMPDVTWTIEDADRHLAAALGRTALAVLALTPKIALADHELAALSSLAYNIGPHNYRASTLRLRLLHGDRTGAAAQFNRWIYARAVRLPGLVVRRAAERATFAAV